MKKKKGTEWKKIEGTIIALHHMHMCLYYILSI